MPDHEPPPWQGQPAPPERTPDGREIRRTRFGAFVRREDGALVPYYTAEQEWARVVRWPQRPARAKDWSVWDV